MWKVNLKIIVAFWVFMTALTVPAAEGKLITVDDDAPANYISIQPAINYASNGDLIEVRPGTYYEAINFIGKEVRLYSSGGPEVTTIDANGAYHAVQCVSGEDSNTILEGFTITGGNANGPDPNEQCGGGMYCESSSPTLTNCIFTGNTADYGGGMYSSNGSSPSVTDCTFSNNNATTVGGAISNRTNCYPELTNCLFTANTAGQDGGGIWNAGEGPGTTLTNCTFNGNTAVDRGGAIFNHACYNKSSLTNCTFSGNQADSGGAMYNNRYSYPDVNNCSFSNNTANANGGGIYNNDNSSTTLTNCTFSGNSASSGGGMYNSASSPTVTNCILWGDSPDEIIDYDSTTSVAFSDVQGVVWPGPVNIDADPLFVDAAGGDLRLSSSASPCVDSGTISTTGLPATDLAGNPRVVDGDRNGTVIVDMGAYEYQSWLIHNITQDIWYETIQLAIDAAAKEDEIEVSPGTYYEAIDFNGNALRLYSSGGPDVTTIDGSRHYHVVQCVSNEDANTILEGFTITGGDANGPNYPDRDGGGMYNVSSSPKVTNCIFRDNKADHGGGMLNTACAPTLTGCTFQNNSASGTYGGGGLYNHNSSPAVTECEFSGNTATTTGGGMINNSSSSPTVTDCTFSNNSASYGGGMCNSGDSNPTFTKCTFSNNSAGESGGGMYNHSSSPTVTNCIFTANTTDHSGGGMTNIYSSPTLTNCTFSGNSAENYGGGGMANAYSNPTVTNCTFSGNSASYGGGIYNIYVNSLTVINCILWGDTPDEIYNGSTTVTYSDVQGGWDGTGNIDTDPCFVDANNPEPNLWNLRLRPDSPCIDAGDTTVIYMPLDLDGDPRAINDPYSPNTGRSISTSLNVVDMGAYEFQPCRIAGDNNCDGVVDFKDVAILCNNWLAGTEPE